MVLVVRYSCRYARHMLVWHQEFHYDVLRYRDAIKATWHICYFTVFLFFMHYITFVVMLIADYLSILHHYLYMGYVIVALLCKNASEWYISICVGIWYFSQFSIFLFYIVKGRESYTRWSWEAQSLGELSITTWNASSQVFPS